MLHTVSSTCRQSSAKAAQDLLWTEELEENLKNLFNEFREMEEKPAGLSASDVTTFPVLTDVDVLDYIEHNLPRSRTRKQISRHLKELGLDVKSLKPKKVKIAKPKRDGKRRPKKANSASSREASPTRDALSDSPASPGSTASSRAASPVPDSTPSATRTASFQNDFSAMSDIFSLE